MNRALTSVVGWFTIKQNLDDASKLAAMGQLQDLQNTLAQLMGQLQ
jgi:hypothetical protein